MINFNTAAELVRLAEEKGRAIHEIVIAREMHRSRGSREKILSAMQGNWTVMKSAIERGIQNEERSASDLTGGDAKRLFAYRGRGFCGDAVLAAAACAIGISEVNAVMGRIVACPTAGSCGIVPAALYAAQRRLACTDGAVVCALFTAAGIGMVIEQNASIAGAEGGCQAECGSAAGMAAAAVAELAGGSPAAAANAAALAIKNLLGLACDPVAGLVEVPCVKRNGFAAVHALLAADMSLAGIPSVIPLDEVIDAMRRIGHDMPKSLRETSEGGLAVTPTAKAIEARLYPPD